MRDQIGENPTERVHQFYRENQEPVNLGYDSIGSQLNCARNALLPRKLRAVDQVIIQDIWAQTWTGWYILFKITEIRT